MSSIRLKNAQDKLRKLPHIRIIFPYLSDFLKFVFTILEMMNEEMLNRFIEDPTNSVCIEILKDQVPNFEDCARVALNIESAVCKVEKRKTNSSETVAAMKKRPQ